MKNNRQARFWICWAEVPGLVSTFMRSGQRETEEIMVMDESPLYNANELDR
jgi:hypothetical protein